ncbi:hypothetical protein [Rhodobacteraceae phage LS06-2018-MD07]|jgi:hypothetical protein|nr:hypothetical protein [Rhodobacteraceae phage LS06-2018-MD07]
MRSVRILEEPGGMYSAWIFSTRLHIGTYEECVRILRENGEQV